MFLFLEFMITYNTSRAVCLYLLSYTIWSKNPKILPDCVCVCVRARLHLCVCVFISLSPPPLSLSPLQTKCTAQLHNME